MNGIHRIDKAKTRVISTRGRAAALALAAAAASVATVSAATTNNPIPVGGWNHDLILDTPSSSSATASFDLVNFQNFYVNGLVSNGVNSSSYGLGVPQNGTLVSAATGTSTTFQFQPYTANNVLFLNRNLNYIGQTLTTGTLNLSTPSTVSSLAFLAAATNGAQTVNYTLNYTDGTSVAGSLSIGDWFNGANPAEAGVGRATRVVNTNAPVGIDTAQVPTTSGNPRLYEYDIPASTFTAANSGKYLGGITFTIATSATNAAAIYGVSGVTGAALTPTALTFTGSDANNAGAVSGNFDTTTANFTNGSSPATFVNGTTSVTFDDTAATTALTVQTAGVFPVGVTFNNATAAYTLAGSGTVGIGGSGGLALVNTGSLTISNANTYLGDTTVTNGGTLVLASGGSIASTRVVVGTGSTFNVSSGAQPITGSTFGIADAGTVNINSTALNLAFLGGAGTVNLNSTTVTIGSQLGSGSSFSGLIAGTGNLVLTGQSAILGSNIYVGTTTFNTGAQVLVSSPTAFGPTTNTLIFNGNGSGGGFAAATPLTTATGGALFYNYSVGATGVAPAINFSGQNSAELTGTLTNYNASGVTFGIAATATAPLIVSGAINPANTTPGPLFKTGIGTLVLNNQTATPNNFATLIQASNGTIQLNGANQTGSVTAYNVGNATGSTATFIINDNSGFAGRVGGTAAGAQITAKINSSGYTLTLTDTTANTTVSELAAFRGPDNATATWAGLITLAGTTSKISGGMNGTFNLNGIISGTAQVEFSTIANSTTVLNAVNSYTGATVLNGSNGKLVIGVDNAIATAAALTLDPTATGALGTTLDLNGHPIRVGYLSTSSASAPTDKITNSAVGTTAVLTFNSATGASYGGVINDGAGAVALTFNGSATQTLGGASNYSGGTTLNSSGSLLGGTNTAFGTGTITLNGTGYLGSNVAAGITVANAIAFGANGIGLNITNPINITSPLALTGSTPFRTTGTDTTASHGVFSGLISGSGGANISGTVVFTGQNTYSGGTQLTSGALVINNDAAVGTGPINFAGGAISFAGYTSNLNFINNGTSPTSIGAANNGSASMLAGSISGSAQFNYVGPGTLYLTGTNTYTSSTNISGGFLGGNLAPTAIHLTGGSLIYAPNTTNPEDYSTTHALSLNASGGVNTNGNTVTWAGILSYNTTAVTFVKSGPGALLLPNGLKPGNLTITGGNSSAPSTVAFNGPTAIYTQTSTTAGVNVGEAVGDYAQLNVSGGASVTIGSDLNVADTGGSTAVAVTTGVINLSDSASLVKANNVYVGKAFGGVNSLGVVNISGGTLQVAASTGNFYVGGNGQGIVNQTGGNVTAGVVRFANAASGSGVYNLSGTGVLTANQLVSTTAGSSTFNINGGTIIANASSGSFISGLTAVNIGAAGATINTNGNTISIGQNLGSGVVSPGVDGGLTKIGAGTLTLNGANAFTGGVKVNAGTLAVTSAAGLGSGAVTLGGGTLSLPTGGTTTTGFNTSGFSLNHDPAQATYTPVFNSPTQLQLTTAANSEATSAFQTTPVTFSDLGGFTATFTYNHTTGGADGITFGVENSPTQTINGTVHNGGSGAVGGGGSALGFAQDSDLYYIQNGLFAVLDMYHTTIGVPTQTQATGSGNAPTYIVSNASATTLSSNTGQVATVTYNGPSKTLTESVFDPTSGNTYTVVANNVDLAQILGGTAGGSATGYIGFTGGTGGINASQNVSAFSFTSTVPASFSTFSFPILTTAGTSSTISPAVAAGSNSTTIGTLNLGAGSTLNIVPNGTANGAGYTLTTAGTYVQGAATISASNTSAGGLGTVVLGSVSGPGTSLTLTGGGAFVVTGSGGFAGSTAVAGGSSLNVTSGSYSVSSFSGGGNLTSNGVTTIAGGTGTSPTAVTVGAVVVGPNGSLVMAPSTPHAGRNVLVASSLSIDPAGTLDVGNNDAVIHNGSLTAINGYATTGFAGGAMNGKGIISSTAAADSNHLTTVGVILASQSGATSFSGQSVTGTDVLVKYTYFGDANLDGAVDGSDYALIDNGYNVNTAAGTNQLTGWYNGDFNYDGVIDGSDYTLIDNGYNRQAVNLSTASLVASPTALVAGTPTSAVPEPTTLGLVGLGAASLLGRRRRA